MIIELVKNYLTNSKIKIKKYATNLLLAYLIVLYIKQFYKINFGYTQVLFMGSVPRINHLLKTVFFNKKNNEIY